MITIGVLGVFDTTVMLRNPEEQLLYLFRFLCYMESRAHGQGG